MADKLYTKGDTISLTFTVNADITAWKIRAEVFDDEGVSVKLASSNSGGSDDQIKKDTIGTTSSTFTVKVASGATDNIADKGYIEIEVDTGNTVNGLPEISTILRKTEINFVDGQITWTSPS